MNPARIGREKAPRIFSSSLRQPISKSISEKQCGRDGVRGLAVHPRLPSAMAHFHRDCGSPLRGRGGRASIQCGRLRGPAGRSWYSDHAEYGCPSLVRLGSDTQLLPRPALGRSLTERPVERKAVVRPRSRTRSHVRDTPVRRALTPKSGHNPLPRTAGMEAMPHVETS